jgi:small conductance mechanosensitive channel
MEQVDTYAQQFINLIIQYAPKVILALLVLWVGLRIVNRISNLAGKSMEKSGLGADIRPFLVNLINVALKLLLIFSVAGIVGIETTSFVAVLAAAGFAVGLALQGSLSNFASGVMILIFHPYRTGDLVEIEDQMGHVSAIQIFNTIITTLDNRTVIVPNSMAVNGVITNLSTREYLRVDLNVTMPYGEDFAKVEKILLGAIQKTPKVLDNPAPFIGIETFDSHNIVLAVRPYAKTEDYWDVYFEANRNIKQTLSEHNIQVAYSEGVELGPIGK